MGKLYVILVNFNSTEDTAECLETVLKTDYPNLQVIVIDNSDSETPIKGLSDWATGKPFDIKTSFKNLVEPQVTKPIDAIFISQNELSGNSYSQKVVVVKANENKGFAAANNLALHYILQQEEKDCFCWILNNDTVVEKNVPSVMISKIAESGMPLNTTVFGTPLLEYDAPRTVQAIGGLYRKKTGLTAHIGENTPVEFFSENFMDQAALADYPIGASMIVHQDFLQTIGIMNEDYFLFFEELDWVYRAKQQGGSAKILNIFGVYHKQGKSTNAKIKHSKSAFIDITFLRSRMLFAKRFNKKNVWLIYLSVLTLTIGKRIARGNLRIIPRIVKQVFKSAGT